MSARSFLLATVFVTIMVAPAAAVPFAGLTGFGTRGNALVGFDSATPGTITGTLNVTGLRAGDILLGIDTRPSTGALYGIATGNDFELSNRLYTINPVTGVATLVASTSIPAGAGGIAFDPVTDTLRLVSGGDDRNVRVDPVTGVVVTESSLAYADGDVNAGRDPFVGAIAYTNQDQDPATGTQLFGIDLGLGFLVRLDTPSTGRLTTVGATGASFASFGGLISSGLQLLSPPQPSVTAQPGSTALISARAPLR